MDYLTPQDWFFPVPIAYGPGRLAEIAQIAGKAGMTRPLVVTDRGSASLPFVASLMRYLDTGGCSGTMFSEISPNPRDDEIGSGRAAYRENGCDGIIAIGGGSGMDGGKAIALTANNKIDLWDFEFERPAPNMSGHAPFPPLICIPTTAGTGAETESTAMVTDTQKWMKWCVWHSELKPACALLDPEITLGLPKDLTAWTGVDALVHAIEAYCVPGFNPLCDGLALEGLRLVAGHLPRVVAEPSSLPSRGAMLAGSCLAGVAFTKGLGHVHALSHMIGAEYDTHHGLTNAVLLPAVLTFNAPSITDRVGPMAQAMGLHDTSFDALYAKVCEILDTVEIPKTLKEIGVPDDGVERIAAKALQDSAAATNPRPATEQQLAEIMRHALNIGR